MVSDDLTPPKDDSKVLSFCDSICSDTRPFYVPVRVDTKSKELQCFQNVEAKVQRDGGQIVFGWNLTWIPKVYIEAQFHAVWLSPSGVYADVTPEPQPHPSLPQPQKILFLPDIDRRCNRPTVPSRRAALSDPNLVERYIQLQYENMMIEQQMAMAGFSYEAYFQRTQAARMERMTILERLQNAT
jgi:hypothetical protein